MLHKSNWNFSCLSSFSFFTPFLVQFHRSEIHNVEIVTVERTREVIARLHQYEPAPKTK